MEQTLVLIKPDGVQRQLIGEIISRFEQRGLKVVGLKMMQLDRETAQTHYQAHEDKPFFEDLIEYITSEPLIAGVLEGPSAISLVRNMMGATFCQDADPGTIRGDLGHSKSMNLVHGSDSAASAEREISLFFSPDELFQYDLPSENWLHTDEDVEYNPEA